MTQTTGPAVAAATGRVPGSLTINPDLSKTLALIRPFTHAKIEIVNVTLRRPCAGDFEVLDETKGGASGTNRLIAHLSGLSMMAVKKIDGADWNFLKDHLDQFSKDPGPEVRENPRGTWSVLLVDPVRRGESEIAEVEIRRPLAGDFEVMDEAKGTVSGTNRLLAELSGLSLGVIRQMGPPDWQAAQKVIERFLGRSQETGGIS